MICTSMHIGELIACLADSIQKPHFCDLVNVDVVAHPQRAVGDRHAQGARRTGHDVFAGHIAFDVRINVDRLAQRAAGVHSVVEEGVFKVKVGIDEGGRNQRAVGFDGRSTRRQVIRLKGSDPAAGNAHVDDLIRSVEPSMMDRQVHGFLASERVKGAASAGLRDSGTMAGRQRVCITYDVIPLQLLAI